MPAEQINLLCRYRGSGATKPKLSKMGGSAWEMTKAKAKKDQPKKKKENKKRTYEKINLSTLFNYGN